jgi:SPP1 gp7 family putative phage head morphogenesis protein
VDRAEKKLARELDRAEAKTLAQIEAWLREVISTLPWRGGPEALQSWQPQARMSLRRILTLHALSMFSLGRAHGKVLARLARERKLADYELPEVDLDLGKDEKFVPQKAMRALEARQLVLSGVFEADLVAGVKKALLSHLAGTPRRETEEEIRRVLQSSRNRASLIVTTETTYAYNRGRLVAFKEAGVDYVRFSAVMDARTSPQCRSRHGKVMRLDDPELPANTPPLHGNCRSVLTPLYGEYQSRYITPESLDWTGVAPLPRGWKSGGKVEPALPAPAQPATMKEKLEAALAKAAHEVRAALNAARPVQVHALGSYLRLDNLYTVRADLIPRDLGQALLESRGFYEQQAALKAILADLRRRGVNPRDFYDLESLLRRRLEEELRARVLGRVARAGIPEGLDLTRVKWRGEAAPREVLAQVSEWLAKNLEDAALVEPPAAIWPSPGRSGYLPPERVIVWNPAYRRDLVHEYGHHLHYRRPDLAAAIREWFLGRIGEEPLTQIQGCPAGEVGWRDRFFRHYVGRWYGGHAAGRADFRERSHPDVDFGTEVLSMGLQAVYESPGEIYLLDPEHFLLTFCAMKGWL